MSPTVAMLNGDGLPDLVEVEGSSGPGGGLLRVLLSNGDGTFDDYASYDLPGYPYGLAAGQLAGDAATDVVVADGAGGLMLFVGNGDGTLQAPPTSLTASFPRGSLWRTSTPTASRTSWSTARARSFAGRRLPSRARRRRVRAPRRVSRRARRDPRRSRDFERGRPSMALLSYQPAGLTFLLNSRLSGAALDTSVVVGTAAMLHASASGRPHAYQWRKDGVPLSDGGTDLGVADARLTIDPASFADAGTYDVVVTDECGDHVNTAGLSSSSPTFL